MERLRNTAVRELEPSPAYSPNVAEVEAEPTPRDRSALLTSIILLWRQRETLKKVTGVGALLSLLIALLIPNTYESSTRLMAPDIHGGGSEMAMMAGLLAKASGGVAGLASNLLGANNTGALFVGVLRSRTIADNLVDKFNLKKVYWVRKDADAREKLADRTDVSEDRKSGIITIAVVDRDPRRAADLARAYVDELNRLLALVNTSSAHRERVFIEERLELVKKELDAAAKQLSDFSIKNTAIDPKEQGKAMLSAAVTLQGELIADETQLHGLEAIYTDNNVRVRSIKARIAELRHQIQEFRGTDPGQSSGSDDGDNSSYPSFRKLPALGVTYADLYRELKLREAVFETLTQQYELARIEEAKEIPSVKVMDAADIPDKKSGPPRLIILALGAFVSLGLGAMFIIGKAAWQEVDPEDPLKRGALEIWYDTRPAYSRLQNRMRLVRSKFSRNHKERSLNV